MSTEEVTTSLNVDITQFKTAMTAANRYIRQAYSEFDNASAGVEGFADSADGLRAQITKLGKVLEAQEAQAAALQHEYERVSAEQGENSAGAQELAIKLNKAQAAVKKTKAEMGKYEEKLNEAENGTKDTAKETGQMSDAFGKAAAAAGTLAKGLAKITGKAIITGIKGIAAASAGLVTAFLATGEASKEYITEMAKLETAFTQNGHTAKEAKAAYDDLVGVLGETEQSVEAANHLAKLTDIEKDLAKWTGDILPGVFATFGASLPIEGLTEAANETAKTGALTGGLADALNWAGVSEDKFQESLDACSSEQERQALITETLAGLYGEASAAYKETNAAVIENNKANDKLQESLSGVGEAALPITTAFKLIGASILGDMLPNIKTLGTSFSEALGGSKTAAAEMGAAVAGILQQLGQKIVKALPTILTVGTSIITSLVQGIITAAPQLAKGAGQIVQTFTKEAPKLLAAGGQMVSKLLDGIVSNIPSMLQGAVNAAGGFVKGIQTYLPVILSKGAELLGKLGEGLRTALPGLISQGLDILMNLATSLYDAAPKLIDIGFDLISNLVQGLLDALPVLLSKAPEIISKFANIINDNVPKLLKKGMELVLQIVKGIISAIPTLIANIPKIITAIVDVWEAFSWVNLGTKAMTFLKNGITKMGGAIKTAGKNVLNSITSALQSLPGKLLNLGKNGITSLGNAFQTGVSIIKTKATAILTGSVNAIQALPSKLLSIGRNAITSLGNAFQTGVSTLKSKASAIVKGITNAFSSLRSKMVSIGKNAIQGVIDGIGAMVGKLYDSIKDALSGLVDKAKDALGISSPSRVLAEHVGRWIPAGIASGIEKYSNVANRAMVDMAKGAVGAANAELNGSSLNMPGVNGSSAPGTGGGRGGATYVFNQYNNSPKALSRKDIYRQTKNALKFATSNA